MSGTHDLTVSRHGDVAVIEAPNYINNEGGERIGNAYADLAKEGVHRVVLNLHTCALVNSVGISFLIEVLEAIKEAHGHLSFCGASRTIAKTLQIMGLLQTATIHDGQEEAVRAASGNGGPQHGG